EDKDKETRSVGHIRKLIRSAEEIGFDCPEITTLREKSDAIKKFQEDADEMLNEKMTAGLAEIEKLTEIGRAFNVEIPELDHLEILIKQLEWFGEAHERTKPGMMGSLNDVKKFIQRGCELGVPVDEHTMVQFEEKRMLGEFWETKAKEIMEAENIHYQQLDSLSNQAHDIPVNPETLARVDAHLKKQRDAQQQIVALVKGSMQPELRQRPTYKEVRETLEALTDMAGRPPGTLDLEKQQKRHEDWMRRGKKLFGKANAPLHILLQHMQYVEARNEACFDLRDTPRMPVEPSSRANSPEEGHEHEQHSESNRDVFCICRKPEAGMMIECELCHEWLVHLHTRDDSHDANARSRHAGTTANVSRSPGARSRTTTSIRAPSATTESRSRATPRAPSSRTSWRGRTSCPRCRSSQTRRSA
ncbi:MAG: hypothetical protein INR71_13610, partial [Terriglobus roseus]|nr:hypothetical protein [Terriglobus roseus]